MTGLLSGCAELSEIEPVYAEIPWQLLQTKEDKAELQVVDLPIPKGLNLAYKEEKEQLTVWTEKLRSLQELITDKDVYLDALTDRTVFDARVGSIFGDSYRQDLSNELFNLLEEVYSVNYVQPHSINLTGLGRTLEGDTEKIVLTFDLNAVHDESTYKIYPVVMTVSEQGIGESLAWKDSFENPITRRSLMENAFIEENFNDLFRKEWTDFAKAFQDETLYAYAMENSDAGKMDISKKMKPISNKDMTEDTLVNLFVHTRGNMANGAITAFKISDEDALAETTYRYIVPVVDGMKEYDISYSRVENKIISITERGDGNK